jgi:predicted 3-demethylubiquinone-9 3-methyltransferase (glyoxalase superfamily)
LLGWFADNFGVIWAITIALALALALVCMLSVLLLNFKLLRAK